MGLNNRELAVLIWLRVFGLWAVTRPDVRSSLGQALQAAARPPIYLVFASLFVWVGLEVWLGRRLGLWEPGLMKETAIWFITSGVVLFAGCAKAAKQPDFFRRKVLAVITPVVLVEWLIQEFVLPLPIELVL